VFACPILAVLSLLIRSAKKEGGTRLNALRSIFSARFFVSTGSLVYYKTL